MVANITLDILKVVATVLPFVGMALALLASGYVTLRLGPMKRKLDLLQEKNKELTGRIDAANDAITDVRDAIPVLPNYEAREQVLRREIDNVASCLKMDLLKNVAQIARDNQEMRNQILNEASSRVGDISSEFLSRAAIENLIEASNRHLRDHELSEIFRRLGELERE